MSISASRTAPPCGLAGARSPARSITPKIVFSGTAIAAIRTRQPEGADRGRRGDPGPGRAERRARRSCANTTPSGSSSSSTQIEQRHRPQGQPGSAANAQRGLPAGAGRTSTISDTTSSTTDSAAAACGASLSMSAKITMLAIWTLPTIRTSAPISPTARAKASAAPETIAGRSAGSTMRRKVTQVGGAQRRGRLLHLGIELDQHRLHRTHHERQGDEQQASRTARPRVGQMDAERAVGPVQRDQRQAGHDRRAARTAGRSGR